VAGFLHGEPEPFVLRGPDSRSSRPVALRASPAAARSDAEPQAAAASKAPPAKWSFENVVAASGVDFRHTFATTSFSKILEDTEIGRRADRLRRRHEKLDVFLSSGHWVEGVSDPAFKDRTSSARSRLYRNLADEVRGRSPTLAGIQRARFRDGRDRRATTTATRRGTSTSSTGGPNVLYRNDGGKFVDVTAACGVRRTGSG